MNLRIFFSIKNILILTSFLILPALFAAFVTQDPNAAAMAGNNLATIEQSGNMANGQLCPEGVTPQMAPLTQQQLMEQNRLMQTPGVHPYTQQRSF